MSDETLAILERAPLNVPPDDAAALLMESLRQTAGDPDLPNRAATLLGYEALQSREQAIALRQGLIELKLMPFTSGSVEQYKEAVSQQTNANVSTLIDVWQFILNRVYGWAINLSAGPAAFGWIFAWQISAVAAVVWLLSYVGKMHLNGVEVRLFGRWRVKPLKGYETAVPQFVLTQAIAIAARCPGAQFFVDEFVRNGEVLDPFLIVRAGQEEHYIAVWDEPKFEAVQKV